MVTPPGGAEQKFCGCTPDGMVLAAGGFCCAGTSYYDLVALQEVCG